LGTEYLVSLLAVSSWRFGKKEAKEVIGNWEKGLAGWQPWRKTEAEKTESFLSV
jgi:hypothetical protein